MRAYFTMSDQRVYQLSLDRKTGEIQVQPKVKTGSEFVEKVSKLNDHVQFIINAWLGAETRRDHWTAKSGQVFDYCADS